MSVDLGAWHYFVEKLRRIHGSHARLHGELDAFSAFVRRQPEQSRISLLLWAYDRYRELSQQSGESEYFDRSCYSILISTIASANPKPTQEQACSILRRSYHQCGHGSDVESPIVMAEWAFDNQPYSEELFAAARVYLETLRPFKSVKAQNAKRKLEWILWHDPDRPTRNCFAERIHQDICHAPADVARRWQWLLRHTASGLNSSPGRAWSKEGLGQLWAIKNFWHASQIGAAYLTSPSH